MKGAGCLHNCRGLAPSLFYENEAQKWRETCQNLNFLLHTPALFDIIYIEQIEY